VTAVELPERLGGDGVVLRRLRAEDAAAYAAAFRDDPDLGRLLGVDEDPDEESVRRRIGRAGELAVADPDSDAFWGMVNVHSVRERNRRCEVGFWLVPGARRRGAGSAAVSLIVSWAMTELDLLRVEMTTTPDNIAVDALAGKLGFTREGVLRKRNIERGERIDVVFYGVLREEWQQG
jgi:[ribosomal protein S5]-alanine N-acetyltransferase